MSKTALLVVDVQNDFLPPSGSLQVPGGLIVIPTLKELLNKDKFDWAAVLASQDFHPEGHISFASSHPGQKKWQDLELKDARGILYEQKLWPDHCIQNTEGTEINPEVLAELQTWGDKFKLVRKGWHKGVEAYSMFDGYLSPGTEPAAPPTELDKAPHRAIVDYLRKLGVEKVVVVGLAADYCVAHTALSAIAAKFQTVVLLAATKAINEQDAAESWDKIQAIGGKVIGRGRSGLPAEGGPRWGAELREWMKA